MKVALRALLLAAFFWIVPLTSAQEEADRTWYFARTEDGLLVAYTLDGTVNRLLSNVTASGQQWRMDEDTIVGMLTVNGVTALYQMSSIEATPVLIQSERRELITIDSFNLLVDANDRYLTLTTSPPGQVVPSLMIDTATATAVYLTDLTFPTGRFDPQGSAFRYLSADETRNDWRLLARDMETGEEVEVYRYNYVAPEEGFATANEIGTLWNYWSPTTNTVIFDAAGGAIAFNGRIDPASAYVALFRGRVVEFSRVCGSDCLAFVWETVEQASAGGVEPRRYIFPRRTGIMPFQPVSLEPSGNLLMYNVERDELWLGTPGARAELIGTYSSDSLFNALSDLLPPGGGYLLARDVNVTNEVVVWNINARRAVLRARAEIGASIIYRERGFLLRTLNRALVDSRTYYHVYATGDTIELPNTDTGTYFDISRDRRLLYQRLTLGDQSVGGILSYDPATNSYSDILVERGRPLPVRPTRLLGARAAAG